MRARRGAAGGGGRVALSRDGKCRRPDLSHGRSSQNLKRHKVRTGTIPYGKNPNSEAARGMRGKAVKPYSGRRAVCDRVVRYRRGGGDRGGSTVQNRSEYTNSLSDVSTPKLSPHLSKTRQPTVLARIQSQLIFIPSFSTRVVPYVLPTVRKD